jgi:hypothetical protein
MPPLPTAPAPKMSERWSPEALAKKGPWAFLSLLAQGVGLLLVVVGTLVVVILGSYPISCFGSTATSCIGTAQNAYWGLMIARILWTLGLFGLAAGAGIRLQFLHPDPMPDTPEATRIYLARRRGEFVILVVSVLLLFLVLLSSGLASPTTLMVG